MSRHRRRSVALAAIAAVLLVIAVSGIGGAPARQADPMQQVVELRRALSAGQRIVAADLSVSDVAAEWVSPHQLSDPGAALGRRAAVALPAGSPLMDSELRTAEPLPHSRDVSVRLDDAAGLPIDAPDGDSADLYLVEPGARPRVRLVLAGARVIASTRADGAAVATLRVAPADVGLLIRAEASGSLRLVARSVT
jgi:Flp pilus assembly protein CpaB